jgi:hypothetical protein
MDGIWAGRPVFDSRRGQEIFLYSTKFRPALGATQSPVQWVQGALSLDVKRPRREADHLPTSSPEVENAWDIPPFPHTSSWRDVQLINHRVNVTFLRVTCMVYESSRYRCRPLFGLHVSNLFWGFSCVSSGTQGTVWIVIADSPQPPIIILLPTRHSWLSCHFILDYRNSVVETCSLINWDSRVEPLLIPLWIRCGCYKILRTVMMKVWRNPNLYNDKFRINSKYREKLNQILLM